MGTRPPCVRVLRPGVSCLSGQGALPWGSAPMAARSLQLVISGPSVLALVASLMLAGGCEPDDDDDGGPSCVERDAATCAPLYEPTWDRVFTQTIQPSCGTAGAACHASAQASGASGGFVVTDMAATHSALLDGGFVVPGDEACSDLMVRLDTDDTSYLMPPGSQPIDEGERCAVAQWIAQGASP
ncbi:MAG: hypothetical protein KC501_23720 [Myxococcales bacterium]|nr:hypothetical protein [Myxococcales bacterium]